MKDDDRYYAKLIDVLRHLASDYETQVAVLPDFVVVADELAENFDLVFIQLADKIERAGLISHNTWLRLKALDDHFGRMSDQEDKRIWTLDALRDDPEWADIRAEAKSILRQMGEKEGRPDLSWNVYIGGGKTD